jgi:CheY-like chemotaxis protein
MARVLVVDDDPDTLDVLELSISLGGFDTLCASDGVQALELARSHRPDLIILDNMMPIMDGLETTRRLREDPELAHIPIIMATARILDSDVWEGWCAGVDAYLLTRAWNQHVPNAQRVLDLLRRFDMIPRPTKSAL